MISLQECTFPLCIDSMTSLVVMTDAALLHDIWQLR